ncbi:hypothetical protein CB0940_01147 [Cercospora beticola]|uniref:Uncharacterized protein n=1 Tax=Cercospora beticola TaxID=122368 RepID=A0A2G5ICL3_CERBT|nr:hypothetical protein CB0940_01147 [Cercospora beticola]PIB02490.1 hypothetical protein CB0940_01147 [Cercospora beticola]WPA96576.1 hypothetical protein RHO25_001183 [Cercospora beticola]
MNCNGRDRGIIGTACEAQLPFFCSSCKQPTTHKTTPDKLHPSHSKPHISQRAKMSGNEFTERERQMMSLAWQCFDGEPKLDYKKLAGLAGMKNPVSASNAWSKIKKKLNAQAEAVMGEGAATPNSTVKATPGKKRGRKPLGDDNNGETPSKKPKATKAKKAASEDDADEEEGVKHAVKTEKAEDGDSEDDRL